MGGAQPRAASRAWRAPDLPRSEHRGRLTAGRLRRALSLLAVFEPIAVAVHLEDVNVVGEAIEQRAGQALGGEHAGPLVEGQIAGDDDGAAFVALAEDLEQQLGAGRRERDVAQFIDDQKLVAGELSLQAQQTLFIVASCSSLTSAAAVVKPTARPFWQAARPSPRAT